MAQPTLFDVARHNAGLRGAMKALTYMLCWGMVRDDLGRDPTIEEYSEWWKESVRTAYRHQAEFRRAFPNEENPSRLLDIASAQWDARKGVAGLGATLLPA